jgi:hypothetical protein
MMLAGAALLPMMSEARAQVAFTRIQAFGDSYADIGNLWKFTGGIGQLPLYPTGRFSGGTNFVDTTSALLGIPQLNYAVGAAKTNGNTILGPIGGFLQEVQGLPFPGLMGPIKIAPTDLVEINIGGNDARQYYQLAAHRRLPRQPRQAPPGSGINALVGDGPAHRLQVGDVSRLPEAAGFANALSTRPQPDITT